MDVHYGDRLKAVATIAAGMVSTRNGVIPLQSPEIQRIARKAVALVMAIERELDRRSEEEDAERTRQRALKAKGKVEVVLAGGSDAQD